jgi:hypothetical protein
MPESIPPTQPKKPIDTGGASGTSLSIRIAVKRRIVGCHVVIRAAANLFRKTNPKSACAVRLTIWVNEHRRVFVD